MTQLDSTKSDARPAPGRRLEEQIHRQLLDRIKTGAYPQGDRLPPEMEFAAEFGVSRPVIRAALARLREAGLIVSRRGAGSFVNTSLPEPESAIRPLGSIDDIADFYDFRRMLECEMAVQAARRAGTKDIERLEEILAEIDSRIAADLPTLDLDIRFHDALARISGNRFLVETFAMLHPHRRFVGEFVGALSPVSYASHKMHMQREHRTLVRAIASGDAAAARAAMLAHVNGSEHRIFRGTTDAD